MVKKNAKARLSRIMTTANKLVKKMTRSRAMKKAWKKLGRR